MAKDKLNKGPFVIAISVENFVHKSFVSKLKSTANIAGLLVLQDSRVNKSFSEDQSCPNSPSSFYSAKNQTDRICQSKTGWNPSSTDFRFLDLPYPAFLIRNLLDILMIKDCYESVNKGECFI